MLPTQTGVTLVIVGIGTAFTVTVEDDEDEQPLLSVTVKMILAVPAATPVTTPPTTVAVVISLVVHAPVAEVAGAVNPVVPVKVVVLPAQTDVVPDMEEVGKGLTVTDIVGEVAEHATVLRVEVIIR